MKILRPNQPPLTQFSSIGMGETFKTPSGDYLWLRIMGTADINAVALHNGATENFVGTDHVIPVEAHVVVVGDKQ